MIYQEIYVKRLLKLAQHLATGRTYGQYMPMTPPDGKTEEDAPILETHDGIMIGFFPVITDELPYLYPRAWKFNDYAEPVLIRNPEMDTIDAFRKFMGLKEHEFIHIAVPNSQDKRPLLGGGFLSYDSTPNDIANQIFELLATHTRMN